MKLLSKPFFCVLPAMPFTWGGILGLVAFFVVFGWHLLDPSNIGWLMKGDPGQHYLGWAYFRNEPWSWPLGYMESLNYPEGTSIVYTDSLPLFAFLLKPFEVWLPDDFQYRGIWILLCYFMMGGSSMKLLLRIGSSWPIALVGCLFFLSSPVMLLRTLGHYTLAGHWILVLGLLLYLSPSTRRANAHWTVLCIVASLVHFYLLFMVSAIWLPFVLKNVQWGKPRAYLRRLMYPIIHLAIVFCVMWSAGYFVVPSDSHNVGGYGLFSLNLAALWNPSSGGVNLMDQIPQVLSGQIEGFNYLGAGSLILLLVGLAFVGSGEIVRRVREHWMLAGSLSVLLLLAISNRVTIGSHELFTVPLPQWLLFKLSTLRGSGRLFWPIYYLLMLFPFAVLAAQTKQTLAICIVLAGLGLQWYDLAPNILSYRMSFVDRESLLDVEVWDELLDGKTQIAFVPVWRDGDDYLPLAHLAARKGLKFNTGYFARSSYEKSKEKSDRLLEEIRTGNLNTNTLYIMRRDTLIEPKTDLPYRAGILDGYPFIAPGAGGSSIGFDPWQFAIEIDYREWDLPSLVDSMTSNEVLLLAVCDDAFGQLSDDWKVFLRERGSVIDQLCYRGSYALVYRDGKPLGQELSNRSNVELHLRVHDHAVRVESAGNDFGNQAHIEIDGFDFALNRRGINAVVWSPKTGTIRRYLFDTCGEIAPKSRAF